MKRLGLLLLFVIMLVPTAASAHVLKTDGQIGVIMHVDPDDDPIAGQPSSFFFEVKDKQNKFKPNNCDCELVITEAGNEIYRQALLAAGSGDFVGSVTFPKRDVYVATLVGTPVAVGDFQPFKVIYDLRVSRTVAASGTKSSNTPLLVIIGAVAVVFVGLVIVFIMKGRRPSKGGKK